MDDFPPISPARVNEVIFLCTSKFQQKNCDTPEVPPSAKRSVAEVARR